MNNQNRVVWVDWVKTLSIYFVVFGHVGWDLLHPFVYAFHVPAFFVISGYLYKKQNILNTFLSFTIPVLFFSSLWFLFYVVKAKFDFQEVLDTNTWFVYKLDDTRPIFTGLWFLEVLFVGRILLGDAGFDFIRKHYKVVALLSLLASVLIDVFSVNLNWYVTRIIQCFPFLALGIYLKEKNLFGVNPRSKAATLSVVCGTIVFCLLIYVNQYCDIMYNRYNSTYLLFFINAVIGTLLLIWVCQFFKRSSVIETFSIGTLVVLGTHTKVANIFASVIHVFVKNEILDGLLLPLISMVVAYFIIVVCKKYCPCLLGKIKIIK